MPMSTYRKRPSTTPASSSKRQMMKKTSRRNFGVPRNKVSTGIGFPKQMFTNLKYEDQYVIAMTAGALVHDQYTLNGLYDTYYTGAGHQPLYFDQIMLIYNHYMVLGCKMTVVAAPYKTNLTAVKLALSQNDDTVITPSSFNTFAEQSKAQSCIVPEQETSRELVLKWSAKKTFGATMGNTLLRGNVGANPTETSIGVISMQPADNITTSYISLRIKLEYSVVFTELRDIAGS